MYKLSFKLVLVTRFLDTTSSNVNEVIREVLNSFFFFRKRFCTHEKHQKHQKHKHATKQKHTALQANSKGMVVPLHQK